MHTEIDIEATAGRLRTARELAGLSQEDAGRQLDVSTKTIARWEGAETRGFLGELKRIAKVYGTTSEAILGTDGSPDQLATQLASIGKELAELRSLLDDPKRLRDRANALMGEEENAKPKRKRS